MMALVRGVRAASMASGSALKVTGSRSTKTGFAFNRATTPAVAKKVKLGMMTSSPGFRSRAMRATSRASVPLDMPMACFAPV
ncbi:MAG: hypothetical protein BWY56_01808 [Acidobacteria bacterium ADurb.Bin340]|nr:MAG: hypothetical protein BWY56_01808 [Acidobacteria bacterium ADurb.Bin340]